MPLASGLIFLIAAKHLVDNNDVRFTWQVWAIFQDVGDLPCCWTRTTTCFQNINFLSNFSQMRVFYESCVIGYYEHPKRPNCPKNDPNTYLGVPTRFYMQRCFLQGRHFCARVKFRFGAAAAAATAAMASYLIKRRTKEVLEVVSAGPTHTAARTPCVPHCFQ